MDIFSSSVKSQNDSAFTNAASPFIRTRLNVKGRPTTWALVYAILSYLSKIGLVPVYWLVGQPTEEGDRM